jgi:hypothetical protein
VVVTGEEDAYALGVTPLKDDPKSQTTEILSLITKEEGSDILSPCSCYLKPGE